MFYEFTGMGPLAAVMFGRTHLNIVETLGQAARATHWSFPIDTASTENMFGYAWRLVEVGTNNRFPAF